MKKLFLIPLLALAGCATTQGTTIPPEVMAACRAEGGCTLYSAQKLEEVLQQAFDLGVMQGHSRKGSL